MKKLLAAIILATFSLVAISDDEVVILDKFIPFKGKMSRAETRLIFTARSRTWETGDPVVVFHYPSSNRIYIDFVNDVLGYNTSDFTRILEQQMNAGMGNKVKFVRTEDQMLDAVATTDGAIGYVRTYFYLNNGNGDVKKILIAD